MRETSRQIAEQATFQTFANCYLREVAPGRLTDHAIGAAAPVTALEWTLQRQQAVLRAELTYWSLCGPHGFGRVWMRGSSEAAWRAVEPFTAVQALVHEAYRQFGPGMTEALRGCELELLSRILQSYQATASCIDRRDADASDTFLAAEQSLVFGHWLHPTPKSRQGMTEWQQPTYAPEMHGRFALNFFAVKLDYYTHYSSTEHSAADIVRSLFGRTHTPAPIADDEALLPMHPLQAEALLLDPGVQALQSDGALRHLGPAGPLFSATSSMRTVYSPDCDWMLKFSLPVRITNSVRVNRRHELEAGAAMARLFGRTGFAQRYPAFRIIHDPAYVTLEMPDGRESGFEVIFRENPFVRGAEHGRVTVAALTADPLPGERSRIDTIVREIARGTNERPADVARRWFLAYLDVALEPLIALYDTYGIALEAHQQNSLLDVAGGYPAAFYYRDNQGFYLSNDYRESLSRLAPEIADIPSLHHDAAEIDESFAYYLVVNQVFSVVSRIGRDGLVCEEALLTILRDRLWQLAGSLTGAGRTFVLGLLTRPTIAAKANLMTRLRGIDELESASGRAVYTRLRNPLFRQAAALMQGGERALAS